MGQDVVTVVLKRETVEDLMNAYAVALGGSWDKKKGKGKYGGGKKYGGTTKYGKTPGKT